MATLGPIDDPLIAIALALAVSGSVCAALLAANAHLTRPLPAIVATAAAAAITAPLADSPPSRFLNGEEWRYPAATLVALATALTVFIISTFRARRDDARSRWTTVDLTALSIGAFLCIPETGLLRLAPGPLCAVTVATTIGQVRPFDPMSATVLTLLITWLGITGGTGRPSSILGLACGLGLASIGSSLPTTRLGRRLGAIGPASVAVATVAGARVAGTVRSTAVATVMTSAALALAAAALLAERASSEELEGTERQ